MPALLQHAPGSARPNSQPNRHQLERDRSLKLRHYHRVASSKTVPEIGVISGKLTLFIILRKVMFSTSNNRWAGSLHWGAELFPRCQGSVAPASRRLLSLPCVFLITLNPIPTGRYLKSFAFRDK